MTPPAPPRIDPSTAADIEARVRDKLAKAGAWTPGTIPDPGLALVKIFSHFASIIIDRLNRAPDKAFNAFLNLIGVTQSPPRPAIAPLTFHLAQGASGDARVPAGSRVAAVAAPGESDPPVFETTSELFLTGAALIAAYVHDPARDAWSDLSALVGGSAAAAPIPGLTLFKGDQAVGRRLWISDPMFSGQGPRDITIAISAKPTDASFPELVWEQWDGTVWRPFDKSSFTFRRSNGGLRLTFGNMLPIPIAAAVQANGMVSGFRGAWVGARLPNGLGNAAFTLPSQVISAIKVSTTTTRDKVMPDAVFSGTTAVDASKDFLPFGERPRLGDAFLLGCDAVFAPAGPADGDNQQNITLTLTASDIDNGRLPLPPGVTEDKKAVTLAWEYWDGSRWQSLGQSTELLALKKDSTDGGYQFSDGTRAFMAMEARPDANVSFRRPVNWAQSTIAGQLNYWLRVRIAGGGYGRDARYAKVDGKDGYVLDPATWRPPSLRAINCGYKYSSPAVTPGCVLVEANFDLTDQTMTIAPKAGGFTLFPPSAETTPSMYLGFRHPGAAVAFANQPVTLYVGIDENLYRPIKDNSLPISTKPPEVAWEYCDDGGWHWLGAQDQTAGLTRRGLVTFIAPADLPPTIGFGQQACWLRARAKLAPTIVLESETNWLRASTDGGDSGTYVILPRLNRLVTNTVWAHHATSIADEVIGSANAEPDQVLSTSLTPVLEGQRLEIRETEPPSAADQATLGKEEESDFMTIVGGDAGGVSEIWVRWHEVPDFYGSLPGSRHYRIDRLAGVIRFGDGEHGRAPPRGVNNVRISYRRGGGSIGDRPAGTITQMKSAIPYVDSAINLEAAASGADAQSVDEARRRGPAVLRHQNRAVAIVDYEDLAFMASPAVARAKGIPTRGKANAGSVELIVVPRGGESQPVPSLELLQQVRDYVASRASPTIDLRVRGPDWLAVSVSVELAPLSFDTAMDLRRAVHDRLAEFLHPLSGGLGGEGWEFGRRPHRSDFFAVIEQIPGVDHLRALTVTHSSDPPPEADATLVYAGKIDIVLVAPSDAIT